MVRVQGLTSGDVTGGNVHGFRCDIELSVFVPCFQTRRDLFLIVVDVSLLTRFLLCFFPFVVRASVEKLNVLLDVDVPLESQ